MGIERFFSSIEENQITNLESQFTTKHDSKLVCKNFFIDFNSIIHTTSFEIVSKLNYILYKIIDNKVNSKVEYEIEKLTDNIKLIQDTKFKNISAKDFSDVFTNAVINEIVINKVIKYTLNILEEYLVKNELEFLYIAIDGVPSKAKMMEQRKRRFMGNILSDVKKLIFNKYTKELQKDKKRFLYENLKMGWNKNQIGPGTEFMDQLYEELISDNFKLKVKNSCPNIQSLICSGQYEPGEGEKKIVDYLRSKKMHPSTYVIYSPDSDVTLLALLLNNPKSDNDSSCITFLKILRHNQQKKSYDVIDVNKLSDNMFSYVQKNMNGKLNKSNIIDDIVFILTIFGNDFLPKIESINVKYDFNKIINRYIQTIKHNNNNYIIYFDKTLNIKKINFKILLDFIKVIHIDEGGNLQKNYLSSHFKNYSKLKSVMNAEYDNFTTVMNTFLDKVDKFHSDIKSDTLNNVLIKWKGNDELITKLRYFSMFKNVQKTDEFIKAYYNFYYTEHKFPKIHVSLQSYTRSIGDYFHQTNFKNSLKYLDVELIPTQYDKEIYKFEHMLDEYQDKLNSHELELGKISLDKYSFTWKAEKIEVGVKNYYNEFFGIDNIDHTDKQMEKLLKSYITGLIWVFEYYFNNFNPDKYTSVWTYPYLRAPLLKQIYHYLNNNKTTTNFIDNITQKVNESFIEKINYFNTIEHLMYVSPQNVLLSLSPQIYHKLLQEHEYFSNTGTIAKTIVKNSSSDVIDCRGAIFLNKCNINESILPKINDSEFIKLIRSIEKDNIAKKLSGEVSSASSISEMEFK